MNQSRQLVAMMAKLVSVKPKVYERRKMKYYERDLRLRIHDVKCVDGDTLVIDLTGYPMILTNYIYYHCVWNDLDMIVNHKSGKSYRTQSEKEQERIATAIKFYMDKIRYLTDTDLGDDEWPRNDLCLANQILVYDKDDVWKDIGDELNARYRADVTRMIIKRGQAYYDLLDARNDKNWEMTLIDSLNSASHTISFVKREKSGVEREKKTH